MQNGFAFFHFIVLLHRYEPADCFLPSWLFIAAAAAASFRRFSSAALSLRFIRCHRHISPSISEPLSPLFLTVRHLFSRFLRFLFIFAAEAV